MSAINANGERAQLPEASGGFVQQVLSEWAGNDRPKLTHLACLLLRQHGWTYRQIAIVLDKSQPNIVRHCHKARQQISESFRGPTDRDRVEVGFSDPSDEVLHRQD